MLQKPITVKCKMASEDVIELGSSDEEAEPAPKKRKPTPNAMVHIPSKLPGVTIKPAKSVPSSVNNKGLLAKPIVINKSNIGMNNPVNRIKLVRLDKTSTAMMVPIQNRIVRNDIKHVPQVKNKSAINPISVVQNLNKTPIAMKKLTQIVVQKNIEMKEKKFLNKLPPSITVKPVHHANITIKPIQKAGTSGIHKKLLSQRKVVGPKRKPQGEIMTVEIDDEDTSESANASPQWYMRPEDEKVKDIKQDNDCMKVDTVEPSMEEKNNKEPDKTNYVEITIEDSPLKPPVNSNHPDIGKELTITIEDSPVKPIAKANKDVESDSEIYEVMEDKQSKKKLYYPKESKNNKANHVVEIEIDLRESTPAVESEYEIQPASPKHKPNEEIEKSPKQDSGMEKVDLSKKEAGLVAEQAKGIIIEDDEFHPTYQKFIQMCFQLENTEDMKKIVEKKIKAYYRQCPKDYVESEEFIDMVSSKIVSMKASPEKMYLYIKDIVDELNLQRKMAKSAVVTKKVDTEIKSYNVKYEEPQYDSKKQRQIRKLEKTIKKLHRAIQKLEEQEVDFDDDEDSVYLLTERYKERMVRVHAKFCQLTNTKMPSEPRIHIEARPGRPTGPARKLEKWVNRKVPIGTPLPFPDFHDVIRCVRDANEEDKLGWTDIDVMDEARDLFTRCGKKLQRRRQENEWRIAASRISVEIDPAENSLDLKKKLDDNKTVAAKRETELLNKYVDRQNLLKLEAEEIGDKEAEESPVESEEEDVVENDNSMEDTQKRKRRLKRLIHEKSKKDEGKENSVAKDSEQKENNNEIKEVSKDIEQGKENKDTTGEKSNNDELVVEPMPNETEATKNKETGRDSLKNDKENEDNDSDAYKVESDVDELHLLQKLHSENEANTSTLESSDSDTPIAISDTLDSGSEQENGAKSYDVISIENSSYSESEMIIDGSPKECDVNSLNKQNVEELVTANFEIEYSSTGIGDTNKETPVKEAAIAEVEENILLASSDEEVKDKADNKETENTCINLRDDNISISETIVDGGAIEQENVSNGENIMTENNNALELIEVSPDVKENDETVDIIQENIEDDGNSCENTIQACFRMEGGINDVDNSPKDIVKIRSGSDVNSVESTDLQTDTEKKEDTNDHSEIMDITEPNCLEKSLVTKNTAGNKTQNEVSVEEAINAQSATTETSTCDMNMQI